MLKWTLLKNGNVNFDLEKNLVKMLGQTSITPLDFEHA